MVNTNKIKAGTYSGEMTPIGEPTEEDKLFVNDLFIELSGIFPAWKNAFDGIDGIRAAKRNWMAGLVDAGINQISQIQNGLRKARQSDNPFMPSVGQFINWCNVNPEELGLPSVNTALNEILSRQRLPEFGQGQKEYSCGFVFAIANYIECDSYRFARMETEKANKEFSVVYNRYLKRAIAGEVFEIPVMIEDKKDRPVTREECKNFATKHIDALKKSVK